MANYKFNEEKMFMDLTDGIAVIINGDTGIYYGLNGFTSVLFEALTRGVAVEQIEEALHEMPGAPAGLVHDFDAFVEKLIQYELILPSSSEIADFTVDNKIAENDGYIIEIEAYDDAQEMLLADPIHEVKEDTGWTPERESIGYSKEETREREKKVKP